MTLEDIYKLAMTPLPPPPDWSPHLQKLMEYLKPNQTPSPPIKLPVAPDWMQQYVKDRGLKPNDQAQP